MELEYCVFALPVFVKIFSFLRCEQHCDCVAYLYSHMSHATKIQITET